MTVSPCRPHCHVPANDHHLPNLTPFRGPSADPGTVYEIGLARGLDKPVFGYSTTTAGFTTRSNQVWGPPRRDAHGVWRDRDGLSIEEFDLFDNLMVVGGLTVPLIATELPDALRWTDLTVFERCAATAAQSLAGSRAGAPA